MARKKTKPPSRRMTFDLPVPMADRIESQAREETFSNMTALMIEILEGRKTLKREEV